LKLSQLEAGNKAQHNEDRAIQQHKLANNEHRLQLELDA